MSILEYTVGSQTLLLSSELNSLANNSNALGAAFSNNVGGTGNGYTLCDLQLVVTFGTAPSANTGLTLWLLGSQDGATFEDGSSSVTPARMPECVFPVRAVTTQQVIIRRILLPFGIFKPLLQNTGTGQSLASTGNTLNVRPASYQLN